MATITSGIGQSAKTTMVIVFGVALAARAWAAENAAPVAGAPTAAVTPATTPVAPGNATTTAPEPAAKYPKPILEGYTADPYAVVFGDTYYIYPTSDKDQWLTTDFSVWSSKDLIHWKKEGMVLDVTKDLQWAKLRAWAPGIIERKGKYYFYFCADAKIGVATGDKPTGPFADARTTPLIARTAEFPGQPIDPYPFIDDDGTPYLYWGQGNLYVAKLNEDMISLNGSPMRLTPPARTGGRFNEGIVVFKRKGLYYFIWSENDARSDDYRLAYGTAKSALGPIEVAENPIILKKSGLVKGTGHNGIINVPGTDRWYVIYHRHAIPNGNGYTRETCLARMEFTEDGKIKEMDPLAEVFPPDSKGEPITLVVEKK